MDIYYFINYTIMSFDDTLLQRNVKISINQMNM